MRPSNYFLDTYVSPKLSELTKCGASSIAPTPNWLATFILRDALQDTFNPATKSYTFNFIRRVIGARNYYVAALDKLQEHLASPKNHVSAYFDSVLHFESCVSQTYLALQFLMTMTRQNLFTRGDGSPEDLLNRIYNTVKHMDDRIRQGIILPTSTSGIWITNFGLESHGSQISFEQLLGIIVDISNFAQKIVDGPVPINREDDKQA